MGRARDRTKRFLVEHPICCFCGGATPASTRDHIPNRACFPRKEGPEGFEFPACDDCQARLRIEEQFFAFFCRMSDRDNANYDKETSRKLISGIANNLPHLLPNPYLGASEKRRALRNFGLAKPANVAAGDLPMVSLPPAIDPVIRTVAKKLGLALFYRHKSRPAGPDHLISSYWAQAADQKTISRWAEVAEDLGHVEIGSRPNIQFGNRFRYRWSMEEPGLPDIFIVIAQFGLGLTICSMVTDPIAWLEEEIDEDWVSVAKWAGT